jgi:PAS domain S-box-containing protein
MDKNTSIDELAALSTIVSQEPEQLGVILDAINDPLFIVNTDKKIIYFNKSAEDITGFTREEVQGQPCIVGIRCENCLYECSLFDQKELENRKLTIHTKDGKKLQILKNARVFTDSDGNIIGGIETFRDVTRVNRQRQRAKAENLSIKSVLNHMDQGVIVVDSNYAILMVNNYLLDEMDQNPQHMRGRPLRDFLPDVKQDQLRNNNNHLETTTRLINDSGNSHLVHIKPLQIDPDLNSDAEIMLLVRKISSNKKLLSDNADEYSYYGLISKTPSMLEIFNLSETIADSDVSVLIQGESGTGKEVLARAIHDASSRKQQPFHVVNCAVFNENLLESELFGHCRGAFTGAVSDKIGRFELADKGTLFLDEIGEMPPNLQVKLLRFLQDQQFERVGEWKTRQVDVRIIAATNRNIIRQIEKGEFRDDLYYRINVIPVFLPPLRDREVDIPLLLDYFIAKICDEQNLPGKVISEDALEVLTAHSWPGNIRELQNVVLHALTCCKDLVILPRHLPKSMIDNGNSFNNGNHVKTTAEETNTESNIDDLEKQQIVEALRSNQFNRSKTAESLQITRTTLWRKMKRYKLI